MMCCVSIVIVCLLTGGGQKSTRIPSFARQVLTVPRAVPGRLCPYWIDADGDGLADLFVVVEGEERLYLYRQTRSGFPQDPSQVIVLPAGTAWFDVQDVDPSPGMELVLSGPDGLRFYRQRNGLFQTMATTLLEVNQVLGPDSPLKHVPLQKTGKGATLIPAVFADRARLYEKPQGFGPEMVREIPLELSRSLNTVDGGGWSVGANRSCGMAVETTARPAIARSRQLRTAENPRVAAILAGMQKSMEPGGQGTEARDIDGDGQKDLILWSVSGLMKPKTVIAVFMRRADGLLPDQPTSVVRSPGFPIGAGWAADSASVLQDVHKDGRLDIVLISPKPFAISLASVSELCLTRAVNVNVLVWEYDVRISGYRQYPDFTMTVTTVHPGLDYHGGHMTMDWYQWLPRRISLSDVNGDGLPDLLVKRFPTLVQVYPNQAEKGLFGTPPSFEVALPWEGDVVLRDVNGDGISDLYVCQQETARIGLLMSQEAPDQGDRP